MNITCQNLYHMPYQPSTYITPRAGGPWGDIEFSGGPRGDIGRGLIRHVIQILTCNIQYLTSLWWITIAYIILINIIYSYKYLESDLIKHCHVIFIHSLGQPLIVRSTAREEIPRKFPREPDVFPIIVTSLDSTDNKHGVQRQVRRCRRRRNFIYYIEYFRKAAGILLLGV